MASIMPLSFLGALNSCSVSSAPVVTRFDDCEGNSMSHALQVALSSNDRMGEGQYLILYDPYLQTKGTISVKLLHIVQ